MYLLSCQARIVRKFGRGCSRNASSLVIAEHNGQSLSPGTLSTITAASQIGGDISVLIIGKDAKCVANSAASVKGVSSILIAEKELNVAENLAKACVAIAQKYTHVLAPSSNYGKNYFPRLSALLDASPLTDVSAIVDADTFKRPMYAGNAIATVKVNNENELNFASVLKSNFAYCR